MSFCSFALSLVHTGIIQHNYVLFEYTNRMSFLTAGLPCDAFSFVCYMEFQQPKEQCMFLYLPFSLYTSLDVKKHTTIV